MFHEYEVPNLYEWLFGTGGQGSSLLSWVGVMVVLLVVAVLVSLLLAMVRRGPGRGMGSVLSSVGAGIRDLRQISPRRVGALAMLAVQEAVRRKVLVAFVIFFAAVLFGGWFLDPESDDPAKLYISFALTASSLLVMAVALFLSAFSLPTDMTNKTIFTVVTKPVHPAEIVLGRIIGFSAIGTLLVVVMALVSYIFINRAVQHTHQIDAELLELVTERSDRGDRELLQGQTSKENNHIHRATINPETGEGNTDVAQGHWHRITSRKVNGETQYVVGPPQELFMARVPIHAESLRFRDRSGNPTDKGINVGNEWTYRSYISGGTRAAVIWEFEGINEDEFLRGLPLEMTLSIFRTHKGDIERGVYGSIVLKNPNPKKNIQTKGLDFEAKEFTIFRKFVSRDELEDANSGQQLDLYRDLVEDGRLIIEISCLDRGQYFGAAKADLYIRAGNASFFWNFLKGYFCIWLQMVVITCFGVMFSTFLNGAVAMLATLAMIVGGFFTDFVQELASGQMMGGGPFESLYRVVANEAVMVELEEGLVATVVKLLDYPMFYFLGAIHRILPDLNQLSDGKLVATGFNIPGEQLGIQLLVVLGFFIPLFVIGHFVLKGREIAK